MPENVLNKAMMVVDDDELCRRSYAASISVLKGVVPYLREEDEVRTRLERSVKTIARLVAADIRGKRVTIRRSCALGEAARRCRETVVMLSYCRDLHGRFINATLCDDLIGTYREVGSSLEGMGSAGKDNQEGQCEALL